MTTALTAALTTALTTARTTADERTVEPDPVLSGRARIDDLDAQIVRLIAERADLSAQVQSARLAAGGPRIVQSRENEVVGRWRDALGRPGGVIALALLELGRGPR